MLLYYIRKKFISYSNFLLASIYEAPLLSVHNILFVLYQSIETINDLPYVIPY